MKWSDDTYYRAFDHNYRVAYEAGEAHLGAGATHRRAFKRLKTLLGETGLSADGTTLLDIGCGDGTNSIFLCGLGYDYVGIDVSPAAIEKAGQRIRDANLPAEIRVGNAIEARELPKHRFSIVLDSYCSHLLVIDSHRATFFENVRRVMADDGYYILLAQRDDSAFEGPIRSFDEFCRMSGTDPSGTPMQACNGDQWADVAGKRVYLLGRARSKNGYTDELDKAGLRIIYSESWDDLRKVAFVLMKR